jgi:amino acid transporter
VAWLKKIFVGRPLETAEIGEQKLVKKAALAVFSSDALSSTAYATEEILLALMIAGTAALSLSVPVAIMIVGLLWVVVASYSQTLEAYPTGGGAYTVAKENLGIHAALVGGAALLTDYVLTVSVSVAAGIAAITSAVPVLYPHRVALCLLAIFIIMWANLRGVRESAALFAGPVYLFIVCAYLLAIGSLARYWGGAHPVAPSAAPLAPVEGAFSVFVFLRAFASGCTALTGIEAVANGVQAFRPPVARNAKITLWIMGTILGTMFLSVTVSARLYGIVPNEAETVLSQLGRFTFGTGSIYYVIQVSTMAILILAANTSFADFPRLSSFIARDRYMPRQFSNMGDRLVFSNGIIFLGLSAGVLVVVFQGDVHRLIPLYMVGVFVAFTLSQAGMVVHWLKSREKGYRWRMVMNGVGAVTTTVVLLIVGAMKFVHGAWVVLIAIPAQVWVFLAIHRHYSHVAEELRLDESDRMRDLRHTVVVPIAGMNRATLGAIEYARSLSKDVIAVQVNMESAESSRLQEQWEKWVEDVPLVVLNSPFRAVVRPLLSFIDEVGHFRGDGLVTVLLPEFVPARWWERLLHNQHGLMLQGALMFKPNVVVTNVRRQLSR